MAVANTALQQELDKVLDAGPTDSHYYWDCEIHTPSEIIPAELVISMDIIRDYDKAYSDDVRVEVRMFRGPYLHRVVPHRNNLQIVLRKHPLGENVDVDSAGKPLVTMRMRALLEDDRNPMVEGNNEQLGSESTANHTDLETVRFQLLDLAVEKLRLKTTGTIFKKTVPGKALQALLGKVSEGLGVPAAAEIKGVDLVEPDNNSEREHVIIPQGTKAINLPSYVQRHCGGVYYKGMGYYLQAGIWYVYPRFGIDRFSKTKRTLTVVSLPRNRYPYLDRTFVKDGSKVIILSTGGVKVHDDSERLQLNQGNGVRYVAANRMFEDIVEVDDNKAVIAKEDRAAEFLIQQRTDKQNTAYFSEERITDNHCYQSSLLSRRAGSHIELVWENSQPDLVFPGMPVRYMFEAKDEVRIVEGVVNQAHHFITNTAQGAQNSRHRTISNLVLFVEKIELIEEN